MASKGLTSQVNNFAMKLRRREIVGAYPVALETAYLMRNVVSSTRWSSPENLRDIIKQVAKSILPANPLELSIGNIIRRVLFIIREESQGGSKKPKEDQKTHTSLSDILGKTKSSQDSQTSSTHIDLKGIIIEAINEIIDELETLYVSIAQQSREHIHSNEIIMVYGSSKTVIEFLKHAAQKRKFQVIVAEAAPGYSGQKMALTLSQAGIETTLITDSAIFAVMARVNKVILACHAVLANGGLIAKSGSGAVCWAAKYHSIPVVVLTGLYKLSPVHAFDQDTFNNLFSPDQVLDYSQPEFHEVDVSNPMYDNIPPEYVSLFITNVGGHSPTYVYRLLSEYYHQEDYSLE